MNFKVAIVEDNPQASQILSQMLEHYSQENNVTFDIELHPDGMEFINTFHSQYDLVFLDIEMPFMNGMDAAKELRKVDKNTLLVFVTNLAQFAVDGYEVQAFDFIIKPVKYANFKMKLTRIVNELQHRKQEGSILIQTRTMTRKVPTAEILYLEVQNHDVVFHLVDEQIQLRASLSAWEEKLEPYHFARCNSYTLVNLKHVTSVEGDVLMIHNEKLRFSRNKRTAFLNTFAQYIGGTK
jgi:DNA-binding LytR/AlgR family response regulator